MDIYKSYIVQHSVFQSDGILNSKYVQITGQYSIKSLNLYIYSIISKSNVNLSYTL